MTLFSIFERGLPAPDAPAAVPDRFSFLAALLPPVFALAHGLWLELLGYVAAVALIALASLWLGAAAGCWLYLLFAALLGFEAAAIRRAALRRRGWAWRTDLFAADGDLARVAWLERAGAAR